MGLSFNIGFFFKIKIFYILLKNCRPKNDNNLNYFAGCKNYYVFMTGFFVCLKKFFLNCRSPPIQSI